MHEHDPGRGECQSGCKGRRTPAGYLEAERTSGLFACGAYGNGPAVDALLYKMERSGYLIYENVSFSHLMASLERKFNVTIHYNSQKYADEYYNVKFAPHETLEDVLAVLQQLIGIRFKIKGNVVFIN